MGCAFVATGLAVLAWGGLTWSGLDLHAATEARVPDSPYLPGQFRHYVLLPATVAVLAVVQALVALRWRRLATAVAIAGMIEMFALLPYLIGYTGGV